MGMVRVVMPEGEHQVRNGRARSGLGLGMKAMQLRFMVCTNDSAIRCSAASRVV